MGESSPFSEASRRNAALAMALLGLALACCSNAHEDGPADGEQTMASGGRGAGGADGSLGGNQARGGSGSGAGGETTNGSFSPPPCNPDDNTLNISTGDVLTDLPSKMSFSVFDPPTSKQFTGNGSNGDVRVYLPEPAGMDRVFPTATVVDPLDHESANVELVLASGFVNARYVVAGGAKLYAQVTASRVALTLCNVVFYPASDPQNLPEISVSGRVVGIAR